MNFPPEADDTAGDSRPVHVLLTGGPAGLGPVARATERDRVAGRLIVDFHGRHWHFVATGAGTEIDGQMLPIYSWSYTTAIAE
ncbi:DUF5988 family protein [Nocardia sp. BMG51109]|uniref:DUF5988 family protein n=1 Tax=Nocardia sp. BMG51109 TaxID=1056816 RepID=UPI000467A177|nr:DUF5988 family protein [Nocardia sp. BMG51109]